MMRLIWSWLWFWRRHRKVSDVDIAAEVSKRASRDVQRAAKRRDFLDEYLAGVVRDD